MTTDQKALRWFVCASAAWVGVLVATCSLVVLHGLVGGVL